MGGLFSWEFLMKLFEVDGHALHGFKRKEDNDILYSYEVECPDGRNVGVDVHPFVRFDRDLFKKYLDLGRPDRITLRSPEALTMLDIECAWQDKFQPYKNRM
jgi:hypothetical protein